MASAETNMRHMLAWVRSQDPGRPYELERKGHWRQGGDVFGVFDVVLWRADGSLFCAQVTSPSNAAARRKTVEAFMREHFPPRTPAVLLESEVWVVVYHPKRRGRPGRLVGWRWCYSAGGFGKSRDVWTSDQTREWEKATLPSKAPKAPKC